MRSLRYLLGILLQFFRYTILLAGLTIFLWITFLFFKDYVFAGNEYEAMKLSCEKGISLGESKGLSNAMDVCLDETMRVSWMVPWFLILLQAIGVIMLLIASITFISLGKLKTIVTS